VAYGQAANNYISVSPQITLPAFLYGGPGNNTLIAGGGNSVLVGGTGNNTLLSGHGDNILIAGLGGSTLNGSSGNNLEIGGYTDYDNNDVALVKLLAEWSSADSYTTRVDNISGISASGLDLNGSYYFNAVPTALSPTPTVHNNAAVDNLYGGAGMNWYFAHTSGSSPLDHIFSRKPSEIIDTIP
jgi:Ca2+-binding RTX toxin-like protein